MKLIKIICLAAVFIGSNNSYAQQLPLSSQYHQNMLTINPAYSGNQEETRAVASHRSMLTGLAGSPQTSYISVDGQIADGKMGLAFIAFQDQTDILSMTSGMVNYVYRAKLGSDMRLNLGLGVGVQNFSVDMDKAKVINTADPILFGSLRQNRIAFNGEFGAMFQLKGLELGVAVPQLFSSDPAIAQSSGEVLNINSVRHLRASLKYNFDLNSAKTISAYPLFVLRSVSGAPTQWDLSGVLDIKKYGWIGVTYHSTYATSVSMGVRYKGLSLGYAHDFSIGAINDYSKKSSELILTYQIGKRANDNEAFMKKMEEELKKQQELNKEQDEKLEELRKQQEESDKRIEENKVEIEKNARQIEENKKNGHTHSNQNDATNVVQKPIEVVKPIVKPKTVQVEEKSFPETNVVDQTQPTDNSFRTGNATDFVDEKGNSVPTGYYVVIGAFGVKENAERWKQQSIDKGVYKTAIIYNDKLNVREVYLFYSQDREAAMTERINRSDEYPTVWVQHLQ